jgi:DNA-binding NarL/FixJ family response regulator
VLLVGDHASTALAEQVVRNRLHGFLLARDAADACAKAVLTVKRGELWVPRALLVQLLFEHLHASGTGSAEAADDKLTPREVEIVSYVRRGFANKQIAEALAIREDTVKKHLRNAYTKLGVHRRTQIITSAAERFITG